MDARAYKAVILDDDPLFLQSFADQLRCCSYADVLQINTVSTVAELEDQVAQGGIDILFADIDLHGQRNAGIAAVSELFPQGGETQVIYVTGYIENAVDVYETAHLYFLTKPVDLAKLESALSKAVMALRERGRGYLDLVVDRTPTTVAIAHIRYLESQRRKTLVYLGTGKEPLATYQKMSALEHLLPRWFARCHTSYLVNLAYVVKATANACELSDGTMVPVSRAYSSAFKLAFVRYLYERED